MILPPIGRLRLLSASVLLLGVIDTGAAPARAEPSVSLLPLGFRATEFRGPASRLASLVATSDPLRKERELRGQPLVVIWGPDGAAVVALAGEALRPIPLRNGAADLARIESSRGDVPGARAQSRGPLTVTFSDPTPDYVHGVFGAPVEAKSLTLIERRPVPPGPDPKPVPVEVTRLEAGPDAVFEDREPRLAELDGSGEVKVLVVRARRDSGAALAVVGRRDGAWRIVAETPPAGEPRRWLNPAAIADFDGDGRIDVALVRTPHRDGVLQFWTWESGALVLKAEAPGYSNHAFGRTAQDLAAVLRADGRSRPMLVIPTLDRRSIAFLTFDGGVREIRRVALPSPAATGLAVLGAGAHAHVLVGLEDGTVADVRP